MNQSNIDAMARAARAFLEEYDSKRKIMPNIGKCKACGEIFVRDALLANEGAGFLCVVCADKELSRLRRKLAKIERQHTRENSIASSAG